MFDVAIIGSGPAGMTAAIYSARFNLNVAVFESDVPGGAIINTQTVNNYPGFESISGFDLANSMISQMMKYSITFIPEKIKGIKKVSEKEFILTSGNDFTTTSGNDSIATSGNDSIATSGIEHATSGKEYRAKSIIIATGTHDKTLGLESENKFLYKGISWCAVCDGPLYRDKDVAVLGGGMSAISSALTLSKMVSKVYLIHRRDEFRGEKKDLDEVKNTNNIEVLTSYTVKSFNGDQILESITIENKDGLKEIKVSAVFECVGKIPNTEFLNSNELNFSIELDENKYIVVNEELETNVKGIFACGDVIHKKVRQIVTAVNDGAIAAISANNYLK